MRNQRMAPPRRLFDNGISVWLDEVQPGTHPPAPLGAEADTNREATFYWRQRAQQLGMAAVLLALVVGAAALAMHTWATTPTVRIAWPGGECVSVDFGGTCDELPRRYRTVPVKGTR